MEKRIAGISKIGIESKITGEIVYLEQITSDTTLSYENIESESTTGAVFGGRIYTAEINAYINSASTNKLIDWAEKGEALRMSGYGGELYFYWEEDIYISNANLELVVNARDGLDRTNIRIQHIAPYARIGWGKNIFKTVAKLPSDLKPVLPSEAYTPRNGTINVPNTFINNGSTINANLALNGTLRIPFITASEVQVSIGFIGVNSDLDIDFLDVNEAPIGAINIVGNNPQTLNIPASTAYIDIRYSGDDNLVDIYLRLGSRQIFTGL